MKKYYTKDDYIRYETQQNINRKSAIDAINCIIETVKEFDNKVYNVKFKKAVNDKMTLRHFDQTYLSFESYGVYLYVRDNDSYKVDHEKEYSSWNYVDYTYYLPDFFDSSKKIYADHLIPLLIARKEAINGTIEKSKEEIKQINEIEKKYNTIKNLIDEFNAATTSNLKDLFVL